MGMRWEQASSLCVPRFPLGSTCGLLQKPRCEENGPTPTSSWPPICLQNARVSIHEQAQKGPSQDLPHGATAVAKHDQCGAGLRVSFLLSLSSHVDNGIYTEACSSTMLGNILAHREEEAWGRTGAGCLLKGHGARQPVLPAIQQAVREHHRLRACLCYKPTLRLAGAT